MEIFDFTAIKELLATKKKILITTHSNPDGDAIGSSLALFHFMSAMGHDVSVMVPNSLPDFLSWLPGQQHILNYEHEQQGLDELFNAADLLFSLDYNTPSRIGTASGAFIRSEAVKVLIDHHIDPDLASFNHVYSTTEVSSTCELLYSFLRDIDKDLLNKDIAENIYVGIMTDTGSFSYNCNYKSTFLISAELVELGIDTNMINRMIYSNNTESRLRLLGYSLASKLVVLPKYSTAYISLTREELHRFNHKKGDTEGLVNYALSIEGIRFAALFTEREKKIRISFRSFGEFSVNDFARKHFQGGGHRNAAGGDSFVDMDQTISEFTRLLETYSEELK